MPTLDPYREDAAEEAKPPRAWLQGDKLAVRANARLPEICVKCASSGEMRWRKHAFGSNAPQTMGKTVLWGALFGPLGGAIGRRTTALELPFCPRCHARLMNRGFLGLLIMVGFLGTLIYAVATVEDNVRAHQRWLTVVEMFGAIATLAVMQRFVLGPAQIRAARVEEDHVVLDGVPAEARDAILASVQRKKRKPAAADP